MISLATSQIEVALGDSSNSVSELTESFISISETIGAIRAIAAQVPDLENVTSIQERVGLLAEEGGSKVEQAIIAFQFYDRLSQRLSHVCRSLDALGALVGNPARLHNPAEWENLQRTIRSKYVTEEDRKMFDTLIETKNVQLALAEFVKCKHEQQSSSGIELF
jgi:hypothetical protein